MTQATGQSRLRRTLQFAAVTCVFANLIACGSSSDQSSANVTETGGGRGTAGSSAVDSMPNVLPIRVNGGPSAAATLFVNSLYADVTVCIPGTSNCQTIADVLVDTGSSGLRLLASEVTLTLPSVNDSTGNRLGECIVFADTSYLWGSIAKADVQLASEKAFSVPIQIVEPAGFPHVPSACGATGPADSTVDVLGAHGILGVGLFRQDCGAACAANNGPNGTPDVYFGCPNASATSSCTAVAVPIGNQVQNPVSLMSEDNNGVLLSLPAISDQGAPTVSGSLVFGIGTRSNNALGSATVYSADDYGHIATTFNGVTYTGINGSYIDSGTNMLVVPAPSTTTLPVCSDASPFYCPQATQSYTATNLGHNGTRGQVTFNVANADALVGTNNTAFNDLAGESGNTLAWGLPFFFGRNIFVAIERANTPAQAGPYWAY